MNPVQSRRRAASILEITIAIVILGVIAALAIPKLSRADVGSSNAELRAELQVLRTAIELYHHDHHGYPGWPKRSDGRSGTDSARESALGGRVAPPTEEEFVRQLAPYLRNGMPRSPLRTRPGTPRVHVVTGACKSAIETIDADWIYNADTGDILANSSGTDDRGERFDRY